MKSYPQMISDIQIVMDKLQLIEREITDLEGNYWLVRIHPYRTEHNSIDGIIITIIDINTLKKTMNINIELSKQLRDSLSSSKIAWWEWEIDTKNVKYSDVQGKLLGYTEEHFPSDIDQILKLIHKDDYERVRNHMMEHAKGKSSEINVFYRIMHKDGTYRKHHNRANIVDYIDKKPQKIIGTIVDVTDINNHIRMHNEEMERN